MTGRQDDSRWVPRVEIDRVFGDAPPPVVVERLASVRVHVKSREVAARDVQANTMASLEDERRGIHLDGELVRLSRLQQVRFARPVAVAAANDAVGDVEIDAG
jgi:hypothetical protein